MKLSAFFLCIPTLLPLVMTSGCSSPQTAAKHAAIVARAVEMRDFNIAVDYARPQRMSPRYLSPGYGVRILGDSIMSDLPFFGVSHRADFYQHESPFCFSARMDDYSVEPARRGGTRVKVSVRNRQERLVYQFLFGTDGMVSLDVVSAERDNMGYSGALKQKGD